MTITAVVLALGLAQMRAADLKSETPTRVATVTAPSDSGGKWLSYDERTKTVTFALDAGAPSATGPFNFDGYSQGSATLVVPPNSKVVMNFVNKDGTPIVPRSSPIPTRCRTWAATRLFRGPIPPI